MSDDEGTLQLTDRSSNRVRVTLDERGAGQGAGDVRLRVQVRSIGFEGDSDGVWIAGPVITRFVDALTAVERDRRGSATLTSMSPEDFSLEIRIVDSAGHVSASGFLGSCQAYPRVVTARIGFDLEIEPDRLPDLVRGARRLLIQSPG